MTDLADILNEEEEPEDSEKVESKTEEDGEVEPEIQYDDSGEYSDITDEQDITADQSDNIEDNTDRDYDMPDQSTEEKENERSDAVSEEDWEYEETENFDLDNTDTLALVHNIDVLCLQIYLQSVLHLKRKLLKFSAVFRSSRSLVSSKTKIAFSVFRRSQQYSIFFISK